MEGLEMSAMIPALKELARWVTGSFSAKLTLLAASSTLLLVGALIDSTFQHHVNPRSVLMLAAVARRSTSRLCRDPDRSSVSSLTGYWRTWTPVCAWKSSTLGNKSPTLCYKLCVCAIDLNAPFFTAVFFISSLISHVETISDHRRLQCRILTWLIIHPYIHTYIYRK